MWAEERKNGGSLGGVRPSHEAHHPPQFLPELGSPKHTTKPISVLALRHHENLAVSKENNHGKFPRLHSYISASCRGTYGLWPCPPC
jgi:hypothetical protein